MSTIYTVTYDVFDGPGCRRMVQVVPPVDSETEAWETALAWLMDRGWSHVGLDLRRDGEIIDMIAWEPD